MGLRIRQARNVQVRVAAAVILAILAYPVYASFLRNTQALTGPKVEVVSPQGGMQRDLKVDVKVSDDHLSRVKFAVMRLADSAVIKTKTVSPNEGETSLEFKNYDLCSHDRLGKCDASWMVDGAYKIRVMAYASDGTKNVSTYYKVTVDTMAPSVAFTSPDDGSVGENLFVDADLHDDLGLAQYGLEVNGPDGLNFKTKNFETDEKGISLRAFDVCAAAKDECPADLPDGRYTILIWATDGAGNIEGTRLQRIVDRKAPLVSIEPIASPFGGSMKLTGRASDAGSGLETEDDREVVRLTFYNTANEVWQTTVPVDNGTWGYGVNTRAHDFFRDGDYKVVAEVSDREGRSDSATRYFTVDNTAPRVSIQLVSEASMMASSAPISLKGKAGSDTASLKLFLNGNSEPVANLTTDVHGRWSYKVPKESVVMGTYVFTVVAADPYGNTASRTLAPVMITPFVPSEGGVPTNLAQPLADAYIVPRRLPAAGVTAPFTARTNTQEVLGVESAKDSMGDDTAAITTSRNGWKVFGVSWYWWTLFGAAGVGVSWHSVAWVRRRGGQLL